jgi:hypothetical protein
MCVLYDEWKNDQLKLTLVITFILEKYLKRQEHVLQNVQIISSKKLHLFKLFQLSND